VSLSIKGLFILAAVSVGCGGVSAPATVPISGSFPLTEVNGKTLPDTLTVLPSPDPTQPGCAILRTSGALVLDPVTGKFSISIKEKNCSGVESVLLTESGTYRQDGLVLTMTEAGPVEPFTPFTFQGQIEAQQIRVHGFYDYTFGR
jgi:hypothetical protein